MTEHHLALSLVAAAIALGVILSVRDWRRSGSDRGALGILVGIWAVVTLAAWVGVARGAEGGGGTGRSANSPDSPDPSPTLRVLLNWTPHETDLAEAPVRRRERLSALARAIDAATGDRDGRAALVTLLRYESHAAAYVHEGRCSDGPRGARECDSGRAVGPWQLHAWGGELVPAEVEGQARVALSRWRGHRERCAREGVSREEGGFAGYGTGGRCRVGEWARERARYMREVRGRL